MKRGDARGGAAPLPPALEALVRSVADATGLPVEQREEVAWELRAHFEDGLAAGRDPAEMARSFGDPREAARSIREARHTGPAATRARMRRRWTMNVADLKGEVTRTVRALAREPAFAVVVILTLALGVGANTAVFTVLDSVLLEPLPYPEPERLVRLYEVSAEDPGELGEYLRSPVVNAYRNWSEVFDGVGALYTYRETGADITEGDHPERAVAKRVSAGYFETLRVGPVLGRTFLEGESLGPGLRNESRVGAPVAILSHALWAGRYGADQGILGSTLRLDGQAFQVVGVMPEGFVDPLGSPADLWIPEDLRDRGPEAGDWGNFYLTGIARLAPGLTLEAAQARADALSARLGEEHPENEGWSVALRPLHADLVGAQRRSLLWILSAAVGLVLLSACLNVANLVFARGLSRDRDLALRGALGSGRGRIVAHLLTETAVLSVVGGVAGLALGALGVRVLLAAAPDALPVVTAPGLSARVFLFALACTVVALLAFGLAPSLRLSRTPPADVLRAGGRGGSQTRGLKRLRSTLVVAQVAVAVMLLAGAGLLLRSFHELRTVDLGVDDEGVLTFEVHLPTVRYPDGDSREGFHRAFHERVAALPGVEAAGAISWLPVNGRYNQWSVSVLPGWDGVVPADRSRWEGRWTSSDIRVVAGDWFAAAGVDVLRGATPAQVDLAGSPVVWLNRTAAGTIFPDVDPLEQFVYVGSEARRVVGIVEDTPWNSRGTVAPITYIPHAQFAGDRNWALTQTVKARGDLSALRARIRDALAAEDGALVLYRPRTLTEFLASARAQDRFATLLMTVFAALALVVALVGSYGVMAESVARRRREIGIRLALGADPGAVRAMVLSSSLRLSALGVTAGLAGVWAGSRWLQAFLFQVQPRDPWVYVGGALTLLSLGLLAAWIPARQATRVHPAESLAGE